jgi:3-hydroxyisobutyrate dehydrogenase-like beta-hydroxyacid dehydrogenase
MHPLGRETVADDAPTNKRPTMETLGFVGLGHMGGNMAARYLAAGYTVYGEARTRSDVESMSSGGPIYSSPVARRVQG